MAGNAAEAGAPGGVCAVPDMGPAWGTVMAVARARNGRAVRIGQFFSPSPVLAGRPVRTPTPSRFRVRASMCLSVPW